MLANTEHALLLLLFGAFSHVYIDKIIVHYYCIKHILILTYNMHMYIANEFIKCTYNQRIMC